MKRKVNEYHFPGPDSELLPIEGRGKNIPGVKILDSRGLPHYFLEGPCSICGKPGYARRAAKHQQFGCCLEHYRQATNIYKYENILDREIKIPKMVTTDLGYYLMMGYHPDKMPKSYEKIPQPYTFHRGRK